MFKCDICLDDSLNYDDFIFLSCGHYCCKACKKALKDKTSCFMCRQDFEFLNLIKPSSALSSLYIKSWSIFKNHKNYSRTQYDSIQFEARLLGFAHFYNGQLSVISSENQTNYFFTMTIPEFLQLINQYSVDFLKNYYVCLVFSPSFKNIPKVNDSIRMFISTHPWNTAQAPPIYKPYLVSSDFNFNGEFTFDKPQIYAQPNQTCNNEMYDPILVYLPVKYYHKSAFLRLKNPVIIFNRFSYSLDNFKKYLDPNLWQNKSSESWQICL